MKLYLAAALAALSGIMITGAQAAEKPSVTVREVGDGLLVQSPQGQRALTADPGLANASGYRFEIPLSALDRAGGATVTGGSGVSIQVSPVSVSTPSAGEAAASGTPASRAPSNARSDENTAQAGSEKPAADSNATAGGAPPHPAPLDEDATVMSANRLFFDGKFEAALTEIDSLIAQNPHHARAWWMRGSLYQKLGQKDLAANAWAKAKALDARQKVSSGAKAEAKR